MTEQELDLFMRNVLLDAIALDEETNTETIPYTPSLHHQKQIKAMLKNPLRWARDRERPVWKRALKRVAVILLVISRNRQSRQRLDRHGTIVVGSCETFHHYNVQGVK